MTKPVIKTIAQVIAEHTYDPEGTNGGGILATCTCGTPYDWMPDHLQDVILQECFPHLAAIHAELITAEKMFMTKAFYKARYDEYEAQQEDICTFAQTDPAEHILLPFRNDDWVEGYKQAQEELGDIISKHDL